MSADVENGQAASQLSAKFVVAGISLASLRRQLKPAWPKKRQEPSTSVVITVAGDSVAVALPGASISVPALASTSCVVEMPWMMFKNVFAEPFEDGQLVPFEAAVGSFKVGQITTRSPQIIVQSHAASLSEPVSVLTASPQVEPLPPPAEVVTIANPLDAPLGLPLLGAYAYIRKYGLQLHIANQAFVGQQLKVDRLLNKAAALLGPVGVTRQDLERLLDQRVQLEPVIQH
jgi:hypothetical protein